MTTKPISKAKQTKIEEIIRLEQEQIIKENLFISTYTEKLFKLAFDFEINVVPTHGVNSVKILPDGFVFDTDANVFTNYSKITLPHSVIGHNLRNLEDDFSTLQNQIDDLVERRTREQERLARISAAKDKARSLMTPEELKLLGL
jgi:hypothetical protein